MFLNKIKNKFVKESAIYTPADKRCSLTFMYNGCWSLYEPNKLKYITATRSVLLGVSVGDMSHRIIQHHATYSLLTHSINNTNVALSGIKLPLAKRLFK